jgi:hypothetical protein
MFCIYLEESAHKAASKAPADRKTVNPDTSGALKSAEIGQLVRREVGAKWNRLSAQDLSALKDRDDLVREVRSDAGRIRRCQAIPREGPIDDAVLAERWAELAKA